MRFSQFFATAVLTATLGLASNANAVLLTQWNFNSTVPDAATGTGVTTPNLGVGTLALQGGVTATFASGDANGGSTDPATGDDSGYNLTAFPAASTGDKTAGLAFFTSTVGFNNIVVEYDLRHSNSSSRYEQVQYTTNGGLAWTDFAGVFEGALGDTWFNNRTADLSAIPGVNNNAQFGFRVVSTFAPTTTAYTGSTTGTAYATTGTWRFDVAEINGTAVAAVVPEANTFGLLALALPVIGAVVARRRK